MMQRTALLALAALALPGCMTNSASTGAAPPPPVPEACDATAAQAYVGKPADAVAEQARTVLGPNQAATMDFRPDRLNLETDATGIILKARCG
jgi:hypothetical protein